MRIVCALDVHRRQITSAIVDVVSGEVSRGRIAPAARESVREWLAQFNGVDQMHFALEGTTGWRFVVEEVERARHRAHLADPAETAARRGRKRRAKTDRADCDLLLRLLSAGGVPAGLRPRTRAGREALALVELSPAGRELVALALRMIDRIDLELAPLDRTLSLFARRQPGCRELIARLYGVGPVTATAIVAELGDARRFGCSDDAVHHCGLDVTVHQSDKKRAPGHLSHEGPELLRWALFEAAQQACRRASPDYEYYRQVARRIDHNRACLSVARKLCRRAYHILRELGDEALAPIDAPTDEEVIAAAA